MTSLHGKLVVHYWMYMRKINWLLVDFPSPMTQTYCVCFTLNKLLNKQSSCEWFKMQWCSSDITVIQNVWDLYITAVKELKVNNLHGSFVSTFSVKTTFNSIPHTNTLFVMCLDPWHEYYASYTHSIVSWRNQCKGKDWNSYNMQSTTVSGTNILSCKTIKPGCISGTFSVQSMPSPDGYIIASHCFMQM